MYVSQCSTQTQVRAEKPADLEHFRQWRRPCCDEKKQIPSLRYGMTNKEATGQQTKRLWDDKYVGL
jgi:hypothetical protein